MFSLSFDTANAAFADGNLAKECACILRRAAEQIADGAEVGVCMDSNGNRVGSWLLAE